MGCFAMCGYGDTGDQKQQQQQQNKKRCHDSNLT
jgi:hypothetical protein